MAAVAEHYVFDAFGTLFDVHAAARSNAPRIGDQWPRLSEIWRTKQLEYSWIHAALGTHIPFRACTRAGLIYALQVCGLPEALVPAILESYQRLETFPEVPGVLRTLKARGARTAILSNGDPDMLDDLVDNAGLRDDLDALISVAAAGTFKPNPRVYALACETLGVEPSAITFLSSNRWDIAGACASGFRPVWVNRSGAPEEYPHLPAVRTISELSALVS